MGDRLIFLKNHHASSFYKDYGMSLISAGSISPDRTFKYVGKFVWKID
jgi:hypothetical protein